MRSYCRSLSQGPVTGSGCSLVQISNESVEYDWVDGVERLDNYEPGGYHPVVVNELLHVRYRIADKLGFGGYSTIWLAHDDQLKRYVAVKVNISNPLQAGREPSILRTLGGSRSASQDIYAATDTRDAVPSILDQFGIQGPNGTHICYTMVPAQKNLREASFSRLFPIQIARSLSARLAIIVSLVHSKGLVHGGLSITYSNHQLNKTNNIYRHSSSECIGKAPIYL